MRNVNQKLGALLLQLPSLIKLRIDVCSGISKLTNLHQLELNEGFVGFSKDRFVNSSSDDQPLRHITTLSNLTSLRLHKGTQITLFGLSKLPNLRVLWIDGAESAKLPLATFAASLPRLRILVLQRIDCIGEEAPKKPINELKLDVYVRLGSELKACSRSFYPKLRTLLKSEGSEEIENEKEITLEETEDHEEPSADLEEKAWHKEKDYEAELLEAQKHLATLDEELWGIDDSEVEESGRPEARTSFL